MTTINNSKSSNENQPLITPSQLDAWRRMSRDELEALKLTNRDENVDTVLNQLCWIKIHELEISKCWGKINAAMVERTQAEALTTPPEPPAAPDLETRLTSGRPEDRTITRDELADAIALAAAGKVQPIEGHDFVRMPAPPAPKLSKAQREALERISADWTMPKQIHHKILEALQSKGLVDTRWETRFEGAVLVLTDAGRAALKGAK